jgi:hypothetical protein
MSLTLDSAAMVRGQASSPTHYVAGQIDLDASYPTGGYDLADLKDSVAGGVILKDNSLVEVRQHGALTGGRRFVVDVPGQKLLLLEQDGTETPNATNLSAIADLPVTIVAI